MPIEVTENYVLKERAHRSIETIGLPFETFLNNFLMIPNSLLWVEWYLPKKIC